MTDKQIDIPQMSQEQFIQLCQETLNTARTIEALLRGLGNGYDEALNALKNLKTELEQYINNFRDDTAELEKKLNAAKEQMAQVLQQIDDIKPKMEKIYQLAEQTETSLLRLEEINTNIIQIEQRIKNLLANINIDEVERFGERLKQELEQAKVEKIQEMQNALNEATRQLTDGIDEIEKKKQEAIEAIQNASGSGWFRVMQECIITKNHALATLSSKRLDKDKFDRIGSVVNLCARKRKIPAGFVKPNTDLSIIDFSLLYFLSGSVTSDGKTFRIEIPDAKETEFIYSGKEY